jgi:hypothetical protein
VSRTEETRTGLDGDRLVSRTIPLVSSLNLYPPVKAAMVAVENVLRREFNVTGDEARERVRVEITHDVEREIRRLISSNNYHLVHDPRAAVGPMEIMGVSFYVVDHLPAPGWRVRGAPR